MKTILALAICLSLFVVGCGPKAAPAKTSTPNSAEPENPKKQADTTSDTGGGSAY